MLKWRAPTNSPGPGGGAGPGTRAAEVAQAGKSFALNHYRTFALLSVK